MSRVYTLLEEKLSTYQERKEPIATLSLTDEFDDDSDGIEVIEDEEFNNCINKTTIKEKVNKEIPSIQANMKASDSGNFNYGFAALLLSIIMGGAVLWVASFITTKLENIATGLEQGISQTLMNFELRLENEILPHMLRKCNERGSGHIYKENNEPNV